MGPLRGASGRGGAVAGDAALDSGSELLLRLKSARPAIAEDSPFAIGLPGQHSETYPVFFAPFADGYRNRHFAAPGFVSHVSPVTSTRRGSISTSPNPASRVAKQNSRMAAAPRTILSVCGAAAIREFFFATLDAGFGEVEIEPLRVDVIGDVAYEAGRCKMLVPVAVSKRREERGKYLAVLARQSNGEWRIVSDCWSSDLSLSKSSEPDPKAASPAAVPPRPVPPRKGP